MEAINRALEDLDTEQLSITMENMNHAVEALKNLGEKFNSLPSLFGKTQ